MAEIRFISYDIVQPTKINGEFVNRIELTPWDLQFLLSGSIQKGILFQKPTDLQKQLFEGNIVDHLKTTFARTLEFFYPLAGRFGVNVNKGNDTSSFFIDCNNEGAFFIHTIIDRVTVKDILDPVRIPSIVHSFFPMNGKLNIESDTNPFLAVQINELVDGYFIGCTMNHAVVDGSSFWHFLNSWSEISRGSKSISKPPIFSRWFPKETKIPIRIPSSLCSYHADKLTLPLLEERVFHFSKEKIAKLKAKANEETNTGAISSLQALLAYLWQSVIRSQKLGLDQEIDYMLLIGARQRLKLLVPECYFGSAATIAKVSTTVSELLSLGLGGIASRLHQAIALQTSDMLVNNFKIWAENPIVPKSLLITNRLGVSSSPRFNVYGTDFSWGKPVAVRSGSANKSDGKITLFAGAEEGSIDIEVCLSTDKLIALENDKEFMEFVTL